MDQTKSNGIDAEQAAFDAMFTVEGDDGPLSDDLLGILADALIEGYRAEHGGPNCGG